MYRLNFLQCCFIPYHVIMHEAKDRLQFGEIPAMTIKISEITDYDYQNIRDNRPGGLNTFAI